MKIVIAPDSFKESMTAEAVCNAIQAGFAAVFPEAEYVSIPMADGGEGSLEAIQAALDAQTITITAKDAYLRDIQTNYLFHPQSQTAFIEMARICGIELTTVAERNPAVATSFGVGQAIADALDRGAQKIILFIGGSASNDGGAGMVQALGGKLLDGQDKDLPVGCTPLAQLAKMDLNDFDPRIAGVAFEVACDVDNRLLGKQGATYVFGPQKGVKPEERDFFDHCLGVLAQRMKDDLGQDVFDLPGGGAAGGLGAGLAGFCGASLRNGFAIVSDVVKLKEAVQNADWVITGEGRIDSQSARGKVPSGVAKAAAEYNVPVIGIAGSLASDVEELYQQGITALFSITNTPMTLEEAYQRSPENVTNTCKNIALLIKQGS